MILCQGLRQLLNVQLMLCRVRLRHGRYRIDRKLCHLSHLLLDGHLTEQIFDERVRIQILRKRRRGDEKKTESEEFVHVGRLRLDVED